jgi:hypothetical protein
VNGDGGLPGRDLALDVVIAADDLERVIARLLTVGTYGSVVVLAVGPS